MSPPEPPPHPHPRTASRPGLELRSGSHGCLPRHLDHPSCSAMAASSSNPSSAKVIAKGEWSVSSGSSLGHCREPLGSEATPCPLPGSPRPSQHRCADCGLLLAVAWSGAQGLTLPAGPACWPGLHLISPSLGSAAADLKSFSWPPAPGHSHPIASRCPDVLMNLPGQQLPSPVF